MKPQFELACLRPHTRAGAAPLPPAAARAPLGTHIAAANEHGMAMVLTGMRHFRH